MTHAANNERQAGMQASFKRSIIVGLGGSGAEVIYRTRRLLVERFGSLSNIPIVRFLYLDTDPGWVRKMTLEIEQDVRLSPAEIVDLQVPDAQGLYNEIRAGNYPEYGWFSIEKLGGLKSITEGAGTIRQLGRLAFWHHFGRFLEAAEQTVHDLIQAKHSDDVHDRYGVDVEPGINFHIIAGLAGGTGSGCYLDVAYALRELPDRIAIGGANEFDGYLIMPLAFQDVAGETALANGYAALKELNYYNYYYQPQSPLAPIYGRPEWDVTYPHTGKGRVRSVNPPFDCCYLMDTSNGKVHLTRQQVFAMIAQSLYNDYALEFAAHKRALRANIKNQVNQNDALDCPARFFSYGQATVHFPAAPVQKMLAHNLAAKAISYLAHPDTDAGLPADDLELLTDASLSIEAIAKSEAVQSFIKNTIIEDFMPSKGLRSSDILAGILRTRDARLTDVPYQLVQHEKERWIKEKWKKEAFTGRVTAAWKQWERDFSDEGPETAWGDRIRVLATNRKKTEDQLLKAIRERTEQLLRSPERGPAYALAFVRMLKEPLAKLEANFRDEANSAVAIANVLGDVYLINAATHTEGPSLSAIILQKMGEELEELSRVSSGVLSIIGGEGRVRRQAEEYLRWCAHWCRARVEERARRLASQMCNSLGSELDRLEQFVLEKAELFAELHSRLRSFANEWRAKALSTENVGELLLNPSLLKTLEQRLQERRQDTYTPSHVASRALRALGQTLDQLGPQDLSRVEEAIMAAAMEVVGDLLEAGLTETHFAAYDLLTVQYPDRRQLREKMKDTIEKSEPFVRLLPNPPGGHWSPTGRFPQGPVTAKCAAMRGGNTTGDLDRERVLEAIASCGWNPESIQPIADSSQIVFVQECGGFPLRALDGLEEMRKQYEYRRRVPQNPPLHTVRDEMAEVFPEPFAPSREEIVFAVGLVAAGQPLGLIRQCDFPDPSGSEQRRRMWAFLRKIEAIGEERPVPIANTEPALVMHLALNKDLGAEIDRAIDREISAQGEEGCKRLADQIRERLSVVKASLEKEGIDPQTDMRYQMEQDAAEHIIRTKCNFG